MAHVLVVDDDDDIRDLVELALRRQGHTTAAASDGLFALEMINDRAYDVVVLDVGMPRMSGLEVARHVAEGRTAHRPWILMLSAFGTRDEQQRGLDAGADRYLVKPTPLRVVAEAVAELAEKSAPEAPGKLTGRRAAP